MPPLWVLNLLDGRRSFLDIVERAGIPFATFSADTEWCGGPSVQERSLFYIIWTAITAAAVIYVAWVIGHATTPVAQQATNAPIPHTRTPRSVWRSRLTALALAVFLLCYIA